MVKLRWTRWLGACAVMAVAPFAFAADHTDAKSLASDPSSDINDLYAWMNTSGKVVMAMTVFPLADNTAKFSDSVKYVFHTRAGASALAPSEPEVNVICTFDANETASCWVGDKEYVTGDASAAAGISSDSAKLKVFAGLRDDPFFFNLQGFSDTVTTVEGAKGGLTFDVDGCPTNAPAAALVALLGSSTAGPTEDFFAGKNVKAIVVEVDASLLTTATAKQLTIWASTNK